MIVVAAAASSGRAMWYLTRGTGTASLLLLSASVVLGILGPLRFARPQWPRFSIETLHRDISLLVVAVLVVHIATSVLDAFAPIGWIDAVIPFHSAYRPVWMGFGALSFDLLLALVITSLIRRRLGLRTWRAVHWLAYLSWPVAVIHGLGTGTDAGIGWMLILTALCVAAVVAALLVRIARTAPVDPRLRPSAAVATLATVVAIVVFTIVGPLQPNWSRRSGTPLRLLGYRTVSPSSRAGAPRRRVAPAPAAPRSSFSSQLNGTVSQRQVNGGEVVDISLRLSGDTSGRLRIRLAGLPAGGGGLSMTGSQVDLVVPGWSSAWQGRIVTLEGQSFLARVRNRGKALNLQADLNIDDQAGTATGSLSARPTGG